MKTRDQAIAYLFVSLSGAGKKDQPEENSKKEGESWDQVAQGRSKSGRAVAYSSEYTILHNSYPAKKLSETNNKKTQKTNMSNGPK